MSRSARLGLAERSENLSETEINEIIQKFAAKEAEFARARENYTYRQTVRVQELDESGRPIETPQPPGATTYPCVGGGTNWFTNVAANAINYTNGDYRNFVHTAGVGFRLGGSLKGGSSTMWRPAAQSDHQAYLAWKEREGVPDDVEAVHDLVRWIDERAGNPQRVSGVTTCAPSQLWIPEAYTVFARARGSGRLGSLSFGR